MSQRDKLISKVYDDAISTSAKEIGKSLSASVKLALTPANAVIWSADKALRWVSDRVIRYFQEKKVPKGKITSPPLIVEARILQNLQVLAPSEDIQLKNMFASLLAHSMNKDSSIHPSFVSTLGQLTSDEARVLSLISHFERLPTRAWGRTQYADWKYWFFEEWHFHTIDKDNYWQSLDNLEHLGIVTLEDRDKHHPQYLHDHSVGRVFDMWREVAIKSLKSKKHINSITEKRSQEIYKAFGCDLLLFTNWGKRFARACSANEFYEWNKFKIPDWAK